MGDDCVKDYSYGNDFDRFGGKRMTLIFNILILKHLWKIQVEIINSSTRMVVVIYELIKCRWKLKQCGYSSLERNIEWKKEKNRGIKFE